MKKTLLFGLTAVVLFALSASGSWLVRNMFSTESGPEAGATGGEPAKATAEAGSSGRLPQAPPPAAVRPPYSPEAERAAELANTLRERLAAVSEREAQLSSRQAELEMVRQDIRGERAALDELRKQVTAELHAVEEQLNAADRKRSQLEEQRQQTANDVHEMQKKQLDIEGTEQVNLRRMVEMINNMPPESAAQIIQKQADTGKMDTAVKILGQMKERQAAKVLAALTDPALAVQLLEKLRGLKRPAPAPDGALLTPPPPVPGSPAGSGKPPEPLKP